MLNVKVEKMNGILVATSERVAKELGVNHRDLLSKIDGYVKKFGVAKLSADYYIPNKYVHPQNKQEYRNYLITKKGIAQLIGGYSAAVEKAFELNVAYINKFDKMERALKNKELLSLKKQIALLDKKQLEVMEYKERVNLLIKNYEEIYRAINSIYEETEAMRLAVSESNKKLTTIYLKVGINLRESKAMLEKLEVIS